MPQVFDAVTTTSLSVDGVDITAHKLRHELGGADVVSLVGLSGLLADPQKVSVQDEGTLINSRPTINFVGAGVTVTDDGGNSRINVTILGATARDTFRWAGIGKVIVLTDLDGAWVAPRAGNIRRITLHRRLAGSSGTTTVDVNKNQVTVFTTQANRPAIAFGAGNNQISAHTDMNITAFAQNDQLQVDVDTAEGGNPQDVSITMEVEFT